MDKLSDQSKKKKYGSSISADTVAKYFLFKGQKNGELLSNLKLQKLVYYAQGMHLALFEKPIFFENIVAWNYGPVIPELYAKYRKHGSKGIPADETFIPNCLKQELREFLDEIYEAFGQFSALGLMHISHDDKCWKEAFPSKIIKLSAMAADLKKYLNNESEQKK